MKYTRKNTFQKRLFPWLFLLIIALGALTLGYIYFLGKNKSQSLPPSLRRTVNLPNGIEISPSLSPTPTPRPIPQGKTEFSVSMSAKTWPKMTQGFLDPYDPPLSGKQIISIKANDTKPITSITATLKTNNKSNSVSLSLIEGTNLDGRWEGSWEVNDEYSKYYHLIFEGVSGTGKSSIDITLR